LDLLRRILLGEMRRVKNSLLHFDFVFVQGVKFLNGNGKGV